jgi:LAO/AO transport system kinase
MAARDALGGLAPTTRAVLDLMDAAGFDRILVETVGVGQSEREVARAVDTVLVVLMPGQGDGVQAMKAGVAEIASLFVVNKADLPGAERLARELREAADLRAPREDGWTTPVLSVRADGGDGVDRLLEEIDRHRARAGEQGRAPRREWSDPTQSL